MNLGAMVELRVRDENIFSFDMWSLRQGKAKSARNHGIKNTLGLGWSSFIVCLSYFNFPSSARCDCAYINACTDEYQNQKQQWLEVEKWRLRDKLDACLGDMQMCAPCRCGNLLTVPVWWFKHMVSMQIVAGINTQAFTFLKASSFWIVGGKKQISSPRSPRSLSLLCHSFRHKFAKFSSCEIAEGASCGHLRQPQDALHKWHLPFFLYLQNPTFALPQLCSTAVHSFSKFMKAVPSVSHSVVQVVLLQDSHKTHAIFLAPGSGM